MTPRMASRLMAAGACIFVGMIGIASAEDALHEVYFHDLAKTRVGNMTIVQTNPEIEILVFNGGELALEGGNLIVIARHARIDGDTVIRSFTQAAKFQTPGRPNQAARGVDGMKEGDAGGKGAPGGSGVSGENGAAAGKLVLRIGEISAKGRLIVDLSGQGGGKGQNGGQGGQGGRGGNGGIVVYSKAMTPLLASKHFVVRTAAGNPGAGGDPGEAGNPGNGGLGGAGVMECGGGGIDGAAGRRISGAQPGLAGSPGGSGAAIEEQAQ